MGNGLLRILHVEDDTADAERVQGELARTGLSGTFLRVNSKDDFVRAVAEFAPDIVISDHSLGSFDARAVLEHLRAVRPTTPLIVVSGAMSEQLIVDYVRAGVADFVAKSNLARLRPAVEAALAARRKLDRLTPRQVEVLGLLAAGLSTSAIAPAAAQHQDHRDAPHGADGPTRDSRSRRPDPVRDQRGAGSARSVADESPG